MSANLVGSINEFKRLRQNLQVFYMTIFVWININESKGIELSNVHVHLVNW